LRNVTFITLITPLRFSSYVEEIIGDCKCGLPHKRSTSIQIFCIFQILEKKWSTMRQYTRDVLYNIPVEFGGTDEKSKAD
jgi:hypothetical protein